MSMEFPANPTVGQIAQLGAFNYQCVSAAPQPIVWDVIGDAEVQNIGGYNLVEEVALANLPFFDVSVDPNYDYVLEMEGHYGTTSDSILNVIPDDGSLTLNIPWSVNQISTAALVNTVGSLAFQEINTTNYIPISGGQASPNGTSYAHIELNMNGNATGEVAVVTSKAMSFNSGALYQTHETIARARTLATVKLLRIGMVFAGTFNNFLAGRALVYRRSRQPLSFLTGKEPGGMYLYEEVQLAGLANHDFDLLPGYDYEVEMRGVQPVVDNAILRGDLSSDGGSTFIFDQFFYAFNYNDGTGGTVTSVSAGPPATAYLGTNMSNASQGGESDIKILNHDNPNAFGRFSFASLHTGAFNWWATGFVTTTAAASSVLWNKARIALDNGNFAAATMRIYRRNRAITYP